MTLSSIPSQAMPLVSKAKDAGSATSDMDIESSSSRGQVAMPEVMLSFSNAAGGAWDDRELVNAYDAAMDEFHMHHPGPGSWLDKMTAAMNKGQPLDGAKSTSTAWYSASQPAEVAPIPTNIVKEPAAKKQKTKKAGPSSANPYAPAASSHQQAETLASPSYTPPSPLANGETQYDDAIAEYANAPEGTGYDDAEEWYDESYALSAPAESSAQAQQQHRQVAQAGSGATASTAGMGGNHGPAFGVQPTTDVSTFEAMNHAMTAQYWAGYWMGVAQAKAQATNTPTQPAAVSTSTNHRNLIRRSDVQGQGRIRRRDVGGEGENDPVEPEEPSNVFITQQRFGKTSGLKR